MKNSRQRMLYGETKKTLQAGNYLFESENMFMQWTFAVNIRFFRGNHLFLSF